ncbi:MAG: hypothetical protein JRC77_04365 [Deltaproteobacteria bacterium]|nr:hypothetical protein [Deltaproteobacteria bacterium]
MKTIRMDRTQCCWAWLVLCLSLNSGFASAAAAESGPGNWQWSALPIPAQASENGALAMDFSRERLAVGGEQGLWLVELPASPAPAQLSPSPTVRRLFGCREVRDLAFASDGSLWVASAKGLCRLAVGPLNFTGPQASAPASLENWPSGLGNSEVQRLAVASELLVLAGKEGLTFAHASSLWRQWQKAPTNLPRGPVTALALRSLSSDKGGPSTWQVLLGVQGQLWEMEARWQRSAGFAFSKVKRHVLPSSGLRVDPLDVFYDALGAEALVVEADRIFLCQPPLSPGGQKYASTLEPCIWQSERLRLPPGVEVLSAGLAEQGLWLATNRGLFWRGKGFERFEHFLEATDHSAVVAVVARDDQAVFLGERGVFVGSPSGPSSEVTLSWKGDVEKGLDLQRLSAATSQEPSIEEIRKAALAYLDLDPHWIRTLRKGVTRRGALPVVSLRVAAERSHKRGWDYDESFSSGQKHYFNDSDRDRNHEYAVALSLSWDLADLAYHPESIDVSDEARDVLELRDEVLDELTQLYFDRQRSLLDLASLEQASRASSPEVDPSAARHRSLEAERLRLRVEELAAGIDAWTGGWFGERAQWKGSSP